MSNNIPRIEAVVFDCDGVLIDSAKLQQQAEQVTAQPFAEEYGLPFNPDEVDWAIMAGWSRKKIASALYGVELDDPVTSTFRRAVVDTTLEIIHEGNAARIPGSEQFIDYLVLHGLGSKLGVATSSNRDIYTRYAGLHAFDFCPDYYTVAQGECASDKPARDPYAEIMRRMDVDPAHTLVIEDSTSGITSGRYAGAYVLGLGIGDDVVEHLQRTSDAHAVVRNYREAVQLLQPALS